MSDMMFIVSCKSAAEPLVAGYTKGYYCKICGKELQVSPRGVSQLTAGGVPTCTLCGLALANLAKEAGTLAGVLANEGAMARIKEILAKRGQT